MVLLLADRDQRSDPAGLVMDTATTCVHCGQPIGQGQWPVHLAGGYQGKHSCDPADSGLRYGYGAHPAGTDCGGDTSRCPVRA